MNHRDLYVEPKKKAHRQQVYFRRAGGERGYLAEWDAWYAKVRGLSPILRRRCRFMRAREVDKANVGPWQVAARRLKEETYTLYPAYRDPRVSPYAKFFVALLVGYVFSPIDTIPDFILMVSLLDEMVLVPLGVILARKMIPGEVLAECQQRSREVMREGKKPVSCAAAVVVTVWLLLAALGVVLAFRTAQGFGT